MTEESNVVERLYSKQGNYPVDQINGYLLHSKYNPINEANRFAELNYKKNFLHILFGLGNGYIIEEFLKKLTKNEYLIIIEPDKDRTYQYDYKEENVLILSDIGDFFTKSYITNINKQFNNRICFIESPNYKKIHPKEYKQTVMLINEIRQLNRVNINTLNYFAEDWQNNYIQNLVNSYTVPTVDNLKFFKSVPVVIISGGPSLTKQIDLLKEYKDNVITIAAGSTINSLLKHNFEPDIVVSIDGSENNYKHFQNINLNESILVYSLINHYKIADEINGPKAFFNVQRNSILNTFSKEFLEREIIPQVPGAASVANIAFYIANTLSDAPITLIGQDLAYTDNKSHAEGNKFEKEITDDFKNKRKMFYVEGYYGDQVLTDYVFLSMKRSFEDYVKTETSERVFFNCTEGGINIEGFTKIPFKEFIENFVDNTKKVNKSKILSTKQISKDWNNLIKKLDKEIKNYKTVKETSEKALSTLKKNKLENQFEEDIIKKLDRYDKKIKENTSNGLMHYILEPAINKIMNDYLESNNESVKDKFNRVYQQNYDLYNFIYDATKKTLGYLYEARKKAASKLDKN